MQQATGPNSNPTPTTAWSYGPSTWRFLLPDELGKRHGNDPDPIKSASPVIHYSLGSHDPQESHRQREETTP